MQAWKEGRLSHDIVAEQHKVEEAELIIFQVRYHFMMFHFYVVTKYKLIIYPLELAASCLFLCSRFLSVFKITLSQHCDDGQYK